MVLYSTNQAASRPEYIVSQTLSQNKETKLKLSEQKGNKKQGEKRVRNDSWTRPPAYTCLRILVHTYPHIHEHTHTYVCSA